HSAGMLERIILRQPLTVGEKELEAMRSDPLYALLHVHVQSFSRLMNIEIPDAEEYYLMELVKNHREKEQYQ
ncbi:hypothetical protein, partial [Enterococcus sp.]